MSFKEFLYSMREHSASRRGAPILNNDRNLYSPSMRSEDG